MGRLRLCWQGVQRLHPATAVTPRVWWDLVFTVAACSGVVGVLWLAATLTWYNYQSLNRR